MGYSIRDEGPIADGFAIIILVGVIYPVYPAVAVE